MKDDEILKASLDLVKEKAPNTKWMAYVDFTRLAREKRFFLIDIEKEKIDYSWYTSHGSGSGPLVQAKKFSNVPESKCSSKGLMKTGEIYYGKYGKSLVLHGLEPGINDNVLKRHIVIHPSRYVSEDYMNKNENPGRSWGCITLDPGKRDYIIDRLVGGSLVYIKGN